MKYIQKMALLIVVVFSSLFAAVDTARTITFQGYLTDKDGGVVFGQRFMCFRFFNAETAGTEIPNPVAGSSNKRQVNIYNGNYATKITFSEAGLNALNQATLLNGGAVWIEIYVSEVDDLVLPTPASNKKLSPRIQLTAVPYALNTRGLYYDNNYGTVRFGEGYRAIPSNATVKDGVVIEGPVGIGTSSPATKLQVQTAEGNVLATTRVRVVGGQAGYELNGSDTRVGMPDGYTSGALALYTGAVERLYVGATGGVNVGGKVDPGANNFRVAGTARVEGASALVGDVTVTGREYANGGITIPNGQTLAVGNGATTLGGSLGVTGATGLNSSLTVAGQTVLNSGLTVNGYVALPDASIQSSEIENNTIVGADLNSAIVISTTGTITGSKVYGAVWQ